MSSDTPGLQGNGPGDEAKVQGGDALAGQGTPASPPISIEPPAHIDPKSVLKIGLASPVLAWIFIVGLAGLLSSSPDVSTSIGFTAVGAIGLAACYAAWKTGGFSNIRKLRFATVVSDVTMRVMRFIYGLGGVVMSLGAVLALVCLISIIQGTAQVLIAEVALGGLVGGFLIQLVAGKAEITRTGRILALKESFKNNLDSAFKGLAEAQSTLEAIKREVELDSHRLDEDLVENAQYKLSIRGTDENGRRRYSESVRRTYRRSLLATWAGVVVGVVLTELSTALGFGEILKSIFHR